MSYTFLGYRGYNLGEVHLYMAAAILELIIFCKESSSNACGTCDILQMNL
jgi:hypothetical protein